MEAPGDCSPSRKVVSKMKIWSWADIIRFPSGLALRRSRVYGARAEMQSVGEGFVP
jgi:hypothetical protein